MARPPEDGRCGQQNMMSLHGLVCLHTSLTSPPRPPRKLGWICQQSAVSLYPSRSQMLSSPQCTISFSSSVLSYLGSKNLNSLPHSLLASPELTKSFPGWDTNPISELLLGVSLLLCQLSSCQSIPMNLWTSAMALVMPVLQLTLLSPGRA